MADPGTQISKSTAIPPQKQIFGFLYWKAYDKIWSGRAMRGLEIFFWIPLCSMIGFQTAGYESPYQLKAGYYANLILLVVTPFVVGLWSYKAYFSFGKVEESLKSVPISAFSILLPRFLAVLATAFQFFLPLFVLVCYHVEAGFVGLPFTLFLYPGWVCLLTGLAFLSGSLSRRPGGDFLLWYFVPMVLINVVGVLVSVGLYVLAWSGTSTGALVIAASGLFGWYIGGLILFKLACKTWKAGT